jgi:2-polyprenyl-3-methyl-5-hydroxy-6-metoxy-1,4-benzoquinol methylase
MVHAEENAAWTIDYRHGTAEQLLESLTGPEQFDVVLNLGSGRARRRS